MTKEEPVDVSAAEPVIEAAAATDQATATTEEGGNTDGQSIFAGFLSTALAGSLRSNRREQYAEAALKGMNLSDLVLKHQTDISAIAQTIATACFTVADAMIAEAERRDEADIAAIAAAVDAAAEEAEDTGD